jgi:hypothetical protein
MPQDIHATELGTIDLITTTIIITPAHMSAIMQHSAITAVQPDITAIILGIIEITPII